jgi:hypothetical protein
MSTGFIYTITTLNANYLQKSFSNVPTQHGDRIYFGPCKKVMRPKVRPGDYIFGISPTKPAPRRIVFVGQVEERITFGDAYNRFPGLRGPTGPIHVRPVQRSGAFPYCAYEHIPGAEHEERWAADLASPEMDAFFVCHRNNEGIGQWLGECGPKIDEEIFTFLKTCSVYGKTGFLSTTNSSSTLQNPIAYGQLFTGLHLETNNPELLVDLCRRRLASAASTLRQIQIPVPQATSHASLEGGRRPRSCGR